jgi:dTDP-4-dehydrorhamnose reductase
MKILIAGSSGLLGRSLFKKLSTLGFEIDRINRFKNEDILYEYHINDPLIPLVRLKYDAIINCAYCYEDKRLDERNINLVTNKNLLAFSKKNKIPIFINISSMSAYEGCKSNYGKVKLKIEKTVTEAGGYSFRLGLFESDTLVGLIKTIYKASKLIPFFSIGVGCNYLPQYITNLNKFSLLLMTFIKDNHNYKDSVYSAVNSLPLDFNEIVYAVTKKPTIKIPLSLLRNLILFYELSPLPKIRFNSDSLNGLVFATDNPKNIIALENI